jgi:hypothetical protein
MESTHYIAVRGLEYKFYNRGVAGFLAFVLLPTRPPKRGETSLYSPLWDRWRKIIPLLWGEVKGVFKRGL